MGDCIFHRGLCKSDFSNFPQLWTTGVDQWMVVGETAKMHIGKALRTVRLDRGLSTRELARDIGTHNLITTAEANAYPRTGEVKMRAIAARLGVSIEDILLMGLMGPTLDVADQFRFRTAKAMLSMSEAEVTELWTHAHQIVARRNPPPLPNADTHAVVQYHDPQMQGPRSRPLAPPPPLPKGIDTRVDPDHNDPQPPAPARRRA